MAAPEGDIRAITAAEVQAILDLDFEHAFELYEQKTRENQGTADAEEAHFRAEADRLARENDSSYNEQLEHISSDYKLTSRHYNRIWQGLSRSLAARQREEAAAIEEKWRAARGAQLKRKAEIVDAQLGTARILALCQKFGEAIEVRNAAQKLRDDDQTPELTQIDREFATHFRIMIRRHETEFQNLLTHLNSVVSALKHTADGQKLTAEAVLRKKNAVNATRIIESVSQSPVSPAARDKVIQA
jgi:hypothetical protein